MKVLVTGALGQLGSDVMCELDRRGYDYVGTGVEDTADNGFRYRQLDITDRNAVFDVIREERPDAVLHLAAWTAVDAAEDRENRDAVYAVNVSGTRYLAEACKDTGAKMLYISTDYVFGNDSTKPRDPDDKNFAPVNYYGETKLGGEIAASEELEELFVVRISWVFGKHGNNFVRTMLEAGKKYPELRVINDQVGSPTYTRDLAVLLADIAESDKYGFYHATNEGEYISWYDFAVEIFKAAGYDTKVIPVTTEEYGFSKALRPHNSRMDKKKLAEKGFCPLPHWRDALRRYLEEING